MMVTAASFSPRRLCAAAVAGGAAPGGCGRSAPACSARAGSCSRRPARGPRAAAAFRRRGAGRSPIEAQAQLVDSFPWSVRVIVGSLDGAAATKMASRRRGSVERGGRTSLTGTVFGARRRCCSGGDCVRRRRRAPMTADQQPAEGGQMSTSSLPAGRARRPSRPGRGLPPVAEDLQDFLVSQGRPPTGGAPRPS